MIRFVMGPDEAVVPDIKRKLPGRGVWVSLAKSSVEQAVQKGLFSKGFKAKLKPDETLPDLVEALLRRQSLDYLGLARKAGQLATGLAKVEALTREGAVSAIVHSAEAASDGRSKLEHAIKVSGQKNVEVFRSFTGAELDEITGMGNVTHIGLERSDLTGHFIFAAKKFETYKSG